MSTFKRQFVQNGYTGFSSVPINRHSERRVLQRNQQLGRRRTGTYGRHITGPFIPRRHAGKFVATKFPGRVQNPSYKGPRIVSRNINYTSTIDNYANQQLTNNTVVDTTQPPEQY